MVIHFHLIFLNNFGKKGQNSKARVDEGITKTEFQILVLYRISIYVWVQMSNASESLVFSSVKQMI